MELFKQLKKVKVDMKALQSTERTLQALLKLYENSLASAFQVELANTQQQLLLTRRAQEALGVKFKKLAVLITYGFTLTMFLLERFCLLVWFVHT